MQTNDRITIDPGICHGKPCIRGLRYPVENVLELLAGGMTIDDILVDYDDLERDDILAALAYAVRLAHLKSVKVTKDADFVQSFLLRNTPERLLLIASGNVGNAELERLLAIALPAIVDAFGRARYVELTKNSLIIHE